MALRDFTLRDVIARNAANHGGQLAFVGDDGVRVTHREYAQRVEQLAAALATTGLARGDRLAVLAQNSLAYVDLYGAAARLGLIVVPVNWRLAEDEIAYVITDTTPRALFVGPEYQGLVAGARAQFPSVEHCYALSPDAAEGFERFDALAAGGGVAPEVDVAADDGFVIIHTAAVGGRPRGALLSHAGLLAANVQQALAWNLSPQDVHLGVLPLFHVSGLGLLLAVQQAGGATVVLPRFDPPAVLATIAAEKVTVFAEFPPILGTLLDKAAELGSDLSSLRHLTGLDTPETIARFEAACPAARFWTGYGQSEVSGLATMAPFRERPGSAGRPALLTSVAVVGDLDEMLPAGQTGEIVVRGPTVFGGYWGCDEDNAFTFRNGWHHTGDMGRFDEDGHLWYAGRSPAKELIKPGGENVYPAEVERALLEHPAVAEAVVFGVPDTQWGEAIKAVCVLREGATVAAGELSEFVGSRIARYKRPKHVEFVAALPRTAQGQVDRARVKQESCGD